MVGSRLFSFKLGVVVGPRWVIHVPGGSRGCLICEIRLGVASCVCATGFRHGSGLRVRYRAGLCSVRQR